MEKKSVGTETAQTPPVDSRKVIAAALEQNSPAWWELIEITGLIHPTVNGEEISKFTILIDKKTPAELVAFSDDIQRYKEELAKLK